MSGMWSISGKRSKIAPKTLLKEEGLILLFLPSQLLISSRVKCSNFRWF